jgi:hypothetical protein
MVTNKILILEEKPNPSTDYFVLPQLKRVFASDLPVKRLRWGESLDAQDLIGAIVIIVRYLTTPWQHALTANRHFIHQLIYFMDDDLGDGAASQGLPLKYRFKLWFYTQRRWSWFMAHQTEFWVSTGYLKEKYARYHPLEIKPEQLIARPKRCRIFYHATASHRAEIDWLLPVMQAVLQQAPMVDFEIVGDRRTLKAYRKLPRTTIIHPMSWESYQSFIALPGRDIGLAPFLFNPFNAARSYTKIFDIQRAQAHGLFAESGPWAHLIQTRESEAFNLQYQMLPMQTDAWINTLVSWAHEIATQHSKP